MLIKSQLDKSRIYMLIEKLKQYLLNSKQSLEIELSEESPSTFSYNYGRIYEVKRILKWIDNLPTDEEINSIISKIKGTEYEKTYKYNGFNYQELLKLKKMR